MLYNALDGDAAKLRCTAVDADGNPVDTGEIPITIDWNVDLPTPDYDIDLSKLVTEGAKVIYERINDIVTVLNGEVQDVYDQIKDQIKDNIGDPDEIKDKVDDIKDKVED